MNSVSSFLGGVIACVPNVFMPFSGWDTFLGFGPFHGWNAILLNCCLVFGGTAFHYLSYRFLREEIIDDAALHYDTRRRLRRSLHAFHLLRILGTVFKLCVYTGYRKQLFQFVTLTVFSFSYELRRTIRDQFGLWGSFLYSLRPYRLTSFLYHFTNHRVRSQCYRFLKYFLLTPCFLYFTVYRTLQNRLGDPIFPRFLFVSWISFTLVRQFLGFRTAVMFPQFFFRSLVPRGIWDYTGFPQFLAHRDGLLPFATALVRNLLPTLPFLTHYLWGGRLNTLHREERVVFLTDEAESVRTGGRTFVETGQENTTMNVVAMHGYFQGGRNYSYVLSLWESFNWNMSLLGWYARVRLRVLESVIHVFPVVQHWLDKAEMVKEQFLLMYRANPELLLTQIPEGSREIFLHTLQAVEHKTRDGGIAVMAHHYADKVLIETVNLILVGSALIFLDLNVFTHPQYYYFKGPLDRFFCSVVDPAKNFVERTSSPLGWVSWSADVVYWVGVVGSRLLLFGVLTHSK